MGYKINRIMMRPGGVEKQVRPMVPPYLCFTANTAGSTVKLGIGYGSPASVSLETSTDGKNWSAYTIGNTITLSNVGDKVYWRNTSETTTSFSSSSAYYHFIMSGSISASGDVNYIINKNSTTTLTSDYCFNGLFESCSSLTTPPELPATTLTQYCYTNMFYYCTNLTTAPELPATTLANGCYRTMFSDCTNLEVLPKLPATTLTSDCYAYMFGRCSKIKLSTTQTGDYQTPYRIPTTGTGTEGYQWNNGMFVSTGGTFTGTPNINTTYYTSNTVV